jgi:hypothetical protein
MPGCQHLPGCLFTGAAVPLAETLSPSPSLTPSLSLFHLSARAGSLAPPAGMSDNTDVTADRGTSQTDFFWILRVYTWHIPGICQEHIRGICQEYTWYIPGIYQVKKYIYGIYLKYSKAIPVIWPSSSYDWIIPWKKFMGLFRTGHVP